MGKLLLHAFTVFSLLLGTVCVNNFGVVSAQPIFVKNRAFSIARATIIKNKHRYIQVQDQKLGRKRLVKDSVIIKFKKSASKEDIKKYIADNNLVYKNRLDKRLFVLKGKSKSKFLRYLSEIKKDNQGIVELVDINEVKQVHTTAIEEGDTSWRKGYMKKQWHLLNNGVNGLTDDADIDIEGAWTYTRGAGVKVAVIDTGFDIDHPYLKFSQGFNALAFDPSNPELSLNSARIDDASAPKESNETHGTAVAGIIGAQGYRNGKRRKGKKAGVIGVAPDAELIPIRMINDFGEVTEEQIIMAFKQAVAMGARIINNSWGSFDPNLKEGETLNISDLERDTYCDIAENSFDGKGALIVFASGNAGKPTLKGAPEARLSCTMSVGATGSNDHIVRYSNYGEELDLVAPGGGYVSLLTTGRTDRRYINGRRVRPKDKKRLKFERVRGTSFAAPIVSGVAALVLSINPDLSVEELREVLTSTTDQNPDERYDFSSGKDYKVGYGRVNANKAVKAAQASL